MSAAAIAKLRDYVIGVLMVAGVLGMWSMARDLSGIRATVESIDKRVGRLEGQLDSHLVLHANGKGD